MLKITDSRHSFSARCFIFSTTHVRFAHLMKALERPAKAGLALYHFIYQEIMALFFFFMDTLTLNLQKDTLEAFSSLMEKTFFRKNRKKSPCKSHP